MYAISSQRYGWREYEREADGADGGGIPRVLAGLDLAILGEDAVNEFTDFAHGIYSVSSRNALRSGGQFFFHDTIMSLAVYRQVYVWRHERLPVSRKVAKLIIVSTREQI